MEDKNVTDQNVPDDDRYGSHEEFVQYYAQQSETQETLERFQTIYDRVLRVVRGCGSNTTDLDILDVGCGAGTQSLLWAKDGFLVHGIDINAPLVELAKQRAENQHQKIDYRVGSATELPWDSESMDVCLVPELLEHVEEWKTCLDEFARVLKPGGVLFLSTNNKLCPKQQEFNLPLYSWYPHPIKRHYENLAVTSRPELVNYAKYPAVNWFTFFSLRDEFKKRGFSSMDRFDLAYSEHSRGVVGMALKLIRNSDVLRFFSHVATPYTLIVGIKER